ncbi:MAG: hypothetical protein ACOC9Y_07910 [Chloroflexota bacterium]
MIRSSHFQMVVAVITFSLLVGVVYQALAQSPATSAFESTWA